MPDKVTPIKPNRQTRRHPAQAPAEKPVIVLNKAEQYAIISVIKERQAAEQTLNNIIEAAKEIFAGAGLDPEKNYTIVEQGVREV